jgi:hypothetical protein
VSLVTTYDPPRKRRKRSVRVPPPEMQRARAEALALRELGWSYEAIGEKQGVNIRTAWSRVRAALHAMIEEPAKRVLQIEVRRLDRLYKLAAHKAEVLGDPEAIDQCLRISIRRGKLLGMDALNDKEKGPVSPTEGLVDIPPSMPPAAVRAVLEALLRWEMDPGKKLRLEQALKGLGSLGA